MRSTTATPRCPTTGYACSTAYVRLGCRCSVCKAWSSKEQKCYRAVHPERVRESRRRWGAAHPERLRQQRKRADRRWRERTLSRLAKGD